MLADSTPPARVAITRLTVTQFRCYEQARIELDPVPVVLAGPNGAGKTNLLEAISLFSPGRGLRSARLAELKRIGAPADALWGVAAELDTPNGALSIGTGADPGGGDRRSVHMEGRPARAAQIAEQMSVLWLTPSMDRLFAEGASARRRFFDRLVLGLDPAHGTRSNRYERALRQRAKLLETGRADQSWLDGLERDMAETGVAIAAARTAYLARLKAALAIGSDAFPRPDIALSGTLEDALATQSALIAEESFRARLQSNRALDAAAGGTSLIGPHKSDFVVIHAAKSMPAERSSTGEQKALLISILLAAALLTGAERGRAPILLLDEVAAHLDPARRAALFEVLLALGGQFWLTGTEPGPFEPLGNRVARFSVEGASVRRA